MQKTAGTAPDPGRPREPRGAGATALGPQLLTLGCAATEALVRRAPARLTGSGGQQIVLLQGKEDKPP